MSSSAQLYIMNTYGDRWLESSRSTVNCPGTRQRTLSDRNWNHDHQNRWTSLSNQQSPNETLWWHWWHHRWRDIYQLEISRHNRLHVVDSVDTVPEEIRRVVLDINLSLCHFSSPDYVGITPRWCIWLHVLITRVSRQYIAKVFFLLPLPIA